MTFNNFTFDSVSVIHLNNVLHYIFWNQFVSFSIKFIFVKIPGTTSDQNNGNQNEDKMSQPNADDQTSTSTNKSE